MLARLEMTNLVFLIRRFREDGFPIVRQNQATSISDMRESGGSETASAVYSKKDGIVIRKLPTQFRH